MPNPHSGSAINSGHNVVYLAWRRRTRIDSKSLVPRNAPCQSEAEETSIYPASWRHLSTKEQTDGLLDKEIIWRMSRDFQEQVFGAAIQQAYETGKSCRDIRGTIRREWKP